jgi:hypothetical protein
MTSVFCLPFSNIAQIWSGSQGQAGLSLATGGETSGGQKRNLPPAQEGPGAHFHFADDEKTEAQKGGYLLMSTGCVPSCSKVCRALRSDCLDSNPDCLTF